MAVANHSKCPVLAEMHFFDVNVKNEELRFVCHKIMLKKYCGPEVAPLLH